MDDVVVVIIKGCESLPLLHADVGCWGLCIAETGPRLSLRRSDIQPFGEDVFLCSAELSARRIFHPLVHILGVASLSFLLTEDALFNAQQVGQTSFAAWSFHAVHDEQRIQTPFKEYSHLEA